MICFMGQMCIDIDAYLVVTCCDALGEGSLHEKHALFSFIVHGYVLLDITSDTAQGRGGSFQNRKLIGEACCLWRMDGRANPVMGRKVIEALRL